MSKDILYSEITSRVCGECGEEKALNLFYNHRNGPFGHSTTCKKCHKKLFDERSKIRKLNQLCIWCGKPSTSGNQLCKFCTEKVIERVRKRRIKVSIETGNYFGNMCYICKLQSDYFEIFDCHHVDSSKKAFYVSRQRSSAWDSIVVPELEKCVYLCSNCHRRLHFGRFDDLINSGELVLIPGKAGVGRGHGKD